MNDYSGLQRNYLLKKNGKILTVFQTNYKYSQGIIIRSAKNSCVKEKWENIADEKGKNFRESPHLREFNGVRIFIIGLNSQGIRFLRL